MNSPEIYFVCPTNKFVTGGVKQIYRQVEILNKNGFNASVVLKKKRKETWFQNNVPKIYSPYIFKLLKFLNKKTKISGLQKLILFYLKKQSAKLRKDGILVFPEVYGPEIHKIETGIRKVIFNQNCYYTFWHYDLGNDYFLNPYNHPDTLATIVASNDAHEYMRFTFPQITLMQMRLGIDDKVFYFSPEKKKQICFMPRKLTEDVTQVISILKQRKIENGWSFVPIENKNETEVAAIMRESAIFLSFNHKEGFGLPPAEAMACGCYVIGYQGQGGKEYFKKEFSSPIQDGNIIQFVNEIEKTLTIYDKNAEDILQKGKQASEFILNNYNLQNEESDTISIWKQIVRLADQ